jgi:hypothetical protein
MTDTAYYMSQILCPESEIKGRILPGRTPTDETRAVTRKWREADPFVFGSLISYMPLPGKY